MIKSSSSAEQQQPFSSFSSSSSLAGGGAKFPKMKPDFAFSFFFSYAIFQRVVMVAGFLAAVVLSFFVLYRGADYVGLKMRTAYYYYYTSQNPNLLGDVSSYISRWPDSEEYKLESILNDALMQDKTVILTTLNEAWASPNSIVDLFLESFRTKENTCRLLNHFSMFGCTYTLLCPHY